MKLVCFDSPYSEYFNDLADVLERGMSRSLEKEYVSYVNQYSIYLNDFSFKEISPNVDVDFEKYQFVSGIKSLGNISGKGLDLDHIKVLISYYVSLEEYINNNSSAVYFLYNDLRWFNSLAIDILKKNNIQYFVFERGCFRPFTTTMDTLGVNANSNLINQSIGKYTRDKVDNLDKIFFKKRKNKIGIKLKFICYFFMKMYRKNALSPDVNAFLNAIPRKSFLDYTKVLFNEFIPKFKRENVENKFNAINGKVVFVPLQLSNDTQTLINSSFKSTQEFIDRVTKDYHAIDDDNKPHVIFKIHPLDTNRYVIGSEFHVSERSTSDLIKESDLCITINSTVGFEALMMGKDVICLGGSFYTNHNFTIKVNDDNNIFNMCNNEISHRDLIDFKYFVVENYQVPGSVHNYDLKDLEYTVNKIIANFNKEMTCF